MRQIENVTLMGDGGKASIFLQPRGSKMYASPLRVVEETMLVLARRNNCTHGMTLPVEIRHNELLTYYLPEVVVHSYRNNKKV